MKQTFALNDGTTPTLEVVTQKSQQYDSLAIQITKVLDTDSIIYNKECAVIQYRWIYEEINRDDMVVYARFMGREEILKNYKWTKEM